MSWRSAKVCILSVRQAKLKKDQEEKTKLEESLQSLQIQFKESQETIEQQSHRYSQLTVRLTLRWFMGHTDSFVMQDELENSQTTIKTLTNEVSELQKSSDRVRDNSAETQKELKVYSSQSAISPNEIVTERLTLWRQSTEKRRRRQTSLSANSRSSRIPRYGRLKNCFREYLSPQWQS